jgi:hypothetical protein
MWLRINLNTFYPIVYEKSLLLLLLIVAHSHLVSLLNLMDLLPILKHKGLEMANVMAVNTNTKAMDSMRSLTIKESFRSI